jgi:hypothetical protein
MPKVRADFPLDFTDHWIRVRKEDKEEERENGSAKEKKQ